MRITTHFELPTAQAFQALRKETCWGDITLQQASNALRLSLCGLYLCKDKQPIAMARILGDGVLCLFIQDVIIARPFRGMGYGKRLMQDLIRHLGQHYAPECTVGLMAAKGQAKFYEAFGFEQRPSNLTDAGMTSPLYRLDSQRPYESQLAKELATP